MEMGERIGTLIKQLGVSKAEFAKKVGTSASRISNITTGRNKPDAPMLQKTIQEYPQVNPEWLLTGAGEPFQSADQPAVAPAPSPVAAPPAASLSQVGEQQDITLLRQRADYLARENELLKGFIEDLRRLIPHLKNGTPSVPSSPTE